MNLVDKGLVPNTPPYKDTYVYDSQVMMYMKLSRDLHGSVVFNIYIPHIGLPNYANTVSIW